MFKSLLSLFKRRPLHHVAVSTGLEPITIMERTNHTLSQQRDFHEGERTAFEALAAYYSERARQHREAAVALGDALNALAISEGVSALAHDVLAAAQHRDIADAKKDPQGWFDKSQAERSFILDDTKRMIGAL